MAFRNRYRLGAYRIATASEPHSSRLTTVTSHWLDSPPHHAHPWPPRPADTPPHPTSLKRALASTLAGYKRPKGAAAIHTFRPGNARIRIEEGLQFIAVGSELKLLLDASKKATDAIGLGKSGGEMAKY